MYVIYHDNHLILNFNLGVEICSTSKNLMAIIILRILEIKLLV